MPRAGVSIPESCRRRSRHPSWHRANGDRRARVCTGRSVDRVRVDCRSGAQAHRGRRRAFGDAGSSRDPLQPRAGRGTRSSSLSRRESCGFPRMAASSKRSSDLKTSRHAGPQLLPDGKTLLFTSTQGLGSGQLGHGRNRRVLTGIRNAKDRQARREQRTLPDERTPGRQPGRSVVRGAVRPHRLEIRGTRVLCSKAFAGLRREARSSTYPRRVRSCTSMGRRRFIGTGVVRHRRHR